MKKQILLFVLTLALVACETPKNTDKKAIIIKEQIQENAFGQDIGYKPISTEKIADVSYQDVFDVYLQKIKSEVKPIDTIIFYTNKAKEIQREENNAELFHFFDYYLKLLNEYKNVKDKKSTTYSVYKHDYSIINPMFNDTKVNVTNYYFFTPKDSLIGYISDDDFKEYKQEFIQHDKEYLEVIRMKITE